MPRTPVQYQLIREEKRSLIMDTALEHFALNGYHNTTISHIAKHAGISKGLMYNYFKSKRELLTEIISDSMKEISGYFDPDSDGYLFEEEFELFVRRYFILLREKLPFWRLVFQLMLQKDVRDHFFTTENAGSGLINTNISFFSIFSGMLSDYFVRKKSRMEPGYEPETDLNMFISTMEGFSRLTTSLDETDNIHYEKTIDRIVEVYK